VKLPRDLSGAELAKNLGRVGYEVTRKTGSHIRPTIKEPVQHHITIPAHDSLKIGTLSAILGAVAAHLKLTRDELLERLFD